MTSKQRNIRTAQEKFKIVMEGLRGDYGSIAALCNAHGITQTDFYRWRDILMEDGSRLFERGGVDKERQRLETENHRLREAVGRLTMEIKKRLVSAARKRREHKESEANIQLLEKIRSLKCDHPSWGYKRISVWLRKREHIAANHKRVLRLMKADELLVPRNFRLRATRRNPSTERPKPKTVEPNRFWGTDMTKIMLPQSGWAYLHIVIDWGDKKLLAAHLSRTSKSQDWITALEQAVSSEFPPGNPRSLARLRCAVAGKRPWLATYFRWFPQCL